MSISDEVLILRTVAYDDRHAYGQLVIRYQSQIRSSLAHLCNGDTSLAEDLAQETFIKAYSSLKKFKQQAKFKTWLYRIAFNVAYSHFRKTNYIGSPNFSEELDDHMTSLESLSDVNVDAQLDIEFAMKYLSSPEQLVIRLCLQNEFSHQETSEIMQIPLGTVKTHVLRAKKKLSLILSDWQKEE